MSSIKRSAHKVEGQKQQILTEQENSSNDLSVGQNEKPKFSTEQEESGEDSPIVMRSKKSQAAKNFLDDSEDEVDSPIKVQ